MRQMLPMRTSVFRGRCLQPTAARRRQWKWRPQRQLWRRGGWALFPVGPKSFFLFFLFSSSSKRGGNPLLDPAETSKMAAKFKRGSWQAKFQTCQEKSMAPFSLTSFPFPLPTAATDAKQRVLHYDRHDTSPPSPYPSPAARVFAAAAAKGEELQAGGSDFVLGWQRAKMTRRSL